VLVTDCAPVRVRAVAALWAGAKERVSVRYAIAIPAILACVFYVYVLVQLRRDEKRHSSIAPDLKGFTGGRCEFDSFTAVREPGHSFAQWSRLTAKRSARDATSGLRKREQASGKIQRNSLVETAPPVSSGVAPLADDAHSGRVSRLKKKQA
jgi:hypothetical protein